MKQKKQKKQRKRLHKMFDILSAEDLGWLIVEPVADGMEYLAKTLGDVHIEYLDTEGKWGVSCCYEDRLWKNWKRSKSLTDVLAKAVIATDKKKQKQKKR